MRRLKTIDPTGPDLDKDIGRINTIFWNSATAELREAIHKHQSLFQQVEVKVPQDFIPLMIKGLHRDGDKLSQDIAKIIDTQKLFTSPQKRNFLRHAAPEKIRQMKSKLDQEAESPSNGDSAQEQVLGLLNKLEQRKAHLQRKLEAAAALKAAGSPITTDQLLEAMFEHVFSIMYLPHWPALDPLKYTGKTSATVDIETYQATIAPQ